MKVLILAGGLGTRLSEETELKPKPMVEIGGKPILWHIMKISVDMANNSVEIHRMQTEPWKVTMLYTGLESMTGYRIKKAKEYVGNEPFLLTYGDGVADINIKDLIDFHNKSKKTVTMTAVRPSGRFGALVMDNENTVTSFIEKPKGDGSWINGGFFVCEPEVFDFIPDRNDIMFEREPLENLAKAGNLNAYKHEGYWQPMDTLRDKIALTKMWNEGTAKWAVWKKEK